MDTALLFARLLLAGVFVVSGVAKLADRPGSRKALEGFGVPVRFAAPGAIALPLVELAVAALLLPRATVWWDALGALGLLLAFVGGIAYNLAKGRTPNCHCFGQFHSAPIGRTTLVRDAALAAVAGFVLVGGWGGPGPSMIAWLGDLTTGETVAVVLGTVAVAAVAFQGRILFQLLGQNGRMMVRIDTVEERLDAGVGGHTMSVGPSAVPAGLAEGTPAPAFRLEGIYGETMTLDALRSVGKSVLLVFSDPGCGPCSTLMPDIGSWQRQYANRLAVAVIGRGTAEANRAKAAEHGVTNVLLQHDWEVAEAYRAKGTPSAVLVRDDGTIGSEVATGVEAVRQLVSRVARIPLPTTNAVPVRAGVAAEGAGSNGAVNGTDMAPKQPAPKQQSSRIGAPAPDIVLPDLEGTTISLSNFRGTSTLVLFWNPGCGFCQRMADELKAWEADPPAGAPKLLVVSSGTVESNAAMGLVSPTVLDQDFAAGRAFGATGTPSAVLVDADGKIASDTVIGALHVMALANGKDPRMVSGDSSAGPALKKGDPAPAVRLNDLDGKKFDLAKLKGREVALLFWNPNCGYCQWIAPHLKEWDANPPKGAPQLVLVSDGTVDATRELGLRSRTLLDEGFSVGRTFAAIGTPSAVLIDAQGRIGSDVAAGGKQVLDLIGYVPVACGECLEECRKRGGGDACKPACQMGGQCP